MQNRNERQDRQPMMGTSRQLSDPGALLAAILVVLALLGAWAYGKQAPGVDYYVAWVAADAVKNDTQLNIYDPQSGYKLAYQYRNEADAAGEAPRMKEVSKRRSELPMTATPFLYWVTGLLASGDYETDLDVWHLLSLLLLTVSVISMCRLSGYPAATSLLLLLPVLVWFTPFHSDLRVGNVNSFQLGAIALVMWLQTRGGDRGFLLATGLVTGLLVMFKPNLAPITVLLAGAWAVRRQWRVFGIGVAGMALGATLAVAVSSWWLGSATAWLDWLDVIRKTVERPSASWSGNYAALSLLVGSAGPAGQALVAMLLSALCLAAYAWGLRGRDGRAESATLPFADASLLTAMGCIVTMLASSLVWRHYYLLTVAMLIVTLQPAETRVKSKLLAAVMLRLLPAAAFICLLDGAHIGLLGVDQASYWTWTTTASVSILFLSGLWILAYGPQRLWYRREDGELP